MVSQLDPLISDDNPKLNLPVNPRRRTLLQILREADGQLSVADLAEELVRRIGGGSTPRPETDEIQRCRILLYHSDIPKLADAELVAFDSDQRTVTPTVELS